MAIKKYFKQDSNIQILDNEVVGIIGYGIQGQNQALNLRDNNINVIVSNKRDSYCDKAISDGFSVYDIEEFVEKSSIIIMLIPDQAQGDVFKKIEPYLKEKTMLVVAHGYSIRFNKIIPPNNIDIIMLAPRFPGAVLRKNFLDNKGTLGYFDVYQDYTEHAKERGLALAHAIGFTKGNTSLLGVSLKEEAEIDLFIEQFLIPSFLNTIQTGFDVLVENGYSPEISLMELFTSGEIIGLLEEGINTGLYQSFLNNTSPTCQFGVKESFQRIITEETKQTAQVILNEILNNEFSKRLDKDAKQGYPELKKFNNDNTHNYLSKIQKQISKNLT